MTPVPIRIGFIRYLVKHVKKVVVTPVFPELMEVSCLGSMWSVNCVEVAFESEALASFYRKSVSMFFLLSGGQTLYKHL